MSARHAVVLLPGGVLPAEPAYAALLQRLGERVDAVAKDLEVYAGEEPPPDFGLDTEVDGILREADRSWLRPFPSRRLLGWWRLVACVRRTARREASEPGASRTGLGRARPDPGGGRARAAIPGARGRCRRNSSWQSSCGCSLHPASSHRRLPRAHHQRGWPSGPPACKPSSTRSTAVSSTLKRSGRSIGPSTSPSAAAATPTTTAGWPSGWARSSRTSPLETFPERHHFDPPHRIEPERLADSLLALWQRAEP